MKNQALFFRTGPHSQNAHVWPVPNASDESRGTLEGKPCWPPEPGNLEVAPSGSHKNQGIRRGYKLLSGDILSWMRQRESGKMVSFHRKSEHFSTRCLYTGPWDG